MATRPRRAVSLVPLLLVTLAHGAEQKSATPAGSREGTIGVESAPAPSAERRGVYHLLRRGQTLYSLSRAYGVPLDAIAEANGITDPTRIPAGRLLFVPGATRPLDLAGPSARLLAWPVAGRVTSPFASQRRASHEGIDIDGVMGQEVGAAAAGRVLWTGTQRGYGKMVVIDHGGGLTTHYAHVGRVRVKVDDVVEAGDVIAEVGRSGNARGTHLHFEVRREGRPVDPVPLLGGEAAAAGKAR